MKNIIILLMCMGFVFVSCKDDDPVHANDVKALINGKKWNASILGRIGNSDVGNNTFGILIDEVDNKGYLIARHAYASIPMRIGTYSYQEIGLAPWHEEEQIGASFHFLDDDLILSSYLLVEDDSLNFFTVDEYNEETFEISGRFRTAFVVRPPNGLNFPDTIRITDGTYSTVILEN